MVEAGLRNNKMNKYTEEEWFEGKYVADWGSGPYHLVSPYIASEGDHFGPNPVVWLRLRESFHRLKFSYILHVADWTPRPTFQPLPPLDNSAQWGSRSVGMLKTCITHINLFRFSACHRLDFRIQYLGRNFWVNHRILPFYSPNITKTAVVQCWKFPKMFSGAMFLSRESMPTSLLLCIPHFPSISRSKTHTQMTQVNEWKPSLPYMQGYLIRYTTARWDAATWVAKSIHITQLFP